MTVTQRIEFIAVGNELLNGDLADGHAARLGTLLGTFGLTLSAAHVVPDEPDAIAEAYTRATARARLVLVTGGLGPTEDDLTLESVATAIGARMEVHAPTLEALKRRYLARGLPFDATSARQAAIPEGGQVLDNPVGTAPCVRLDRGACTSFFFPGVPRELERLIVDYLTPWLREHLGVSQTRRHLLRTFGKTESQVATLLEPLPRDPRLHVAYRAHFPEIRVGLHVREADEVAAESLLSSTRDHAKELLGPIVYSESMDASMASVIGEQLVARGETLALAESCTGGGIGHLLTGVAGASRWFLEGVITYTNASKCQRLGVDPELIEAQGAVSQAVCCAMAVGARSLADSTWALAVTGISGPGGGSEEKPVGTVHLALAGPEGVVHRHRRLPFDRARNRLLTAWMALDILRRNLS